VRKSNTLNGTIDKLEYYEADLNLEMIRLKNADRISLGAFNSVSNAIDRRAIALRSLKQLMGESI
jgi:hypothetical protein